MNLPGGSGVEHYIRGGVPANCDLDLLMRESNIYLQSVISSPECDVFQ